MNNPWTMKMEQFARFSEEERRYLDELVAGRQAQYAAREDIIRIGEHPSDCRLVLSGLACRYTILPNGERQITAFLIPGDLCDAENFILKAMDHSIGAITPTRTALIPGGIMEGLLRSSHLAKALWWGTLTDLSILRQRIVDHGRRDARERIAHLIYELLVRYRVVDLARGASFEFPITQTDLADATGMTPVHANRVLQGLREEGLITLRGRRLTVRDPERLKKVGGFDAIYLHLERAHDPRSGLGERVGNLV